MKLSDAFSQAESPVISIEVFPPKTPKGEENLFEALDAYRPFRPAFISCTYGAGGSTQQHTLDLCQRILAEQQVPTTAHLTCVGSTKQELTDWLAKAVESGITNIMALRGDPPQGSDEFVQVEGGLKYANELVELIKSVQPSLGIGVAAYPEKHQEAPSLEVDMQNLKRKVDAGADAAFTQLFFENSHFFSFREKFEAMGCSIPLVPGIMPITGFKRIQRITTMCGTYFPPELASKLEAVEDDAEAQFEIGVEFAIKQCRELLDQGVPGIHFYALNKSDACQKILAGLDLIPS